MSRVKYHIMGIPQEILLYCHTMGFDQKLIELDKPHSSQIWETSSHRFPNVWEYPYLSHSWIWRDFTSDNTTQKIFSVACNTSSYDVDAVLSHLMRDESEKPIMLASRTLSKTQKSCSQIKKEELTIIFPVKTFFQFVCERLFTTKTDHKPLLRLLAENKPITATTRARIQRSAIILSVYDLHSQLSFWSSK